MDTVNHVYKLLKKQYPDKPPLYVGDTVYYLLPDSPRPWKFVVDAKITEVQFVINHPVYIKEKHCLWFNIDPRLPNGYECVGPKLPIEKDELGWNKWDRPNPEIVLDEDVTFGNWFIWIDLPVGHGLSPYYDVTPILSHALENATPCRCRKRHRKSALNKYINSGMNFIAKTHKKPVSKVNFPKYRRWPERQIYWRKK